MAIDSLAKRFSIFNFGRTPVFPLPVADGSFVAGDRAHLLNLYSGIALDEPAAGVLVSLQGPIWLSHYGSDQVVPVTMVDTSGGMMEGVTSPTIEITKLGGGYAALDDGTWTELSNGDYLVGLSKADTDTAGWAILRVKTGSSAEIKVLLEIGVSPVEMRGTYTRTRAIVMERR